MYETNRRSLLKTTGAGAGIALGAGTTGVAASEFSSAQQAGVTFTAEATSGSIGIDLDDVANRVTFGGGTSPPVAATIQGVVTSTGRWTGQDGVEQPFTINGVPPILALDPNAKIQTFVQENIANGGLQNILSQTSLTELLGLLVGIVDDLDIPGDVQAPEGGSNELANLIVDNALVPIVKNLAGGSAPVEVDRSVLESELALNVNLVGLLAEPTVNNFETAVTNLPSVLELAGIVSSAPDPSNVDLEALVIAVAGLLDQQANVSTISDAESVIAGIVTGIDVNGLLGGMNLPLVVEPAIGAFDPREAPSGEALVTAEIDALGIDVQTLLQNLIQGVIGPADDVSTAQQQPPELSNLNIPLDLRLTSDTSGGLTGSYDGPTTLVDNEFVAGLEEFTVLAATEELQKLLNDLLTFIKTLIQQQGLDLANLLAQQLGGLQAAELEPLLQKLLLNDDSYLETLELASVVDGNLNEGLVNVNETVQTLFPDQSGDHALELEFNFDFDATLDLDPEGGQPFDMPTGVVDNEVQQGPPTDPGVEDANGNVEPIGLFGDVNGDGKVNVADVQALFQIREDINQNGKPDAYNFAGASQSRVDIFDVQALFYLAT